MDRFLHIAVSLFAAMLAACSHSDGTQTSAAASPSPIATTPAVVATVAAPGVIPLVLPAYEYVSLYAGNCAGADAGRNDPKLWWGLEVCALADQLDARLPAYCNQSCHLYMYVDVGLNGCSYVTASTFAWANINHEAGFLHLAPNSIRPAYRLTFKRNNACAKFGGAPNTEYFQNLGDPALQRFMYTNIWNSTARYGVHQGFSVFNDDVFTGYASLLYGSSEYGGVWMWQRPNGPYANPRSWFAALAEFFNSMCAGERCVHTNANGVGGGAQTCTTVEAGNCYGSTAYAQGYLNNATNTTAVCTLLEHDNLDAWTAERPLYGHGNLDGRWSTVGLIAASVNTAINLALGTGNCAQKYVELEQPSENPSIRSYMTGLQWLVPDPRTGIPDAVVQWRYSTGDPKTRIASFWPEYTIVPQGPEQPISPYRYGGGAPHEALGCPNAGDTGGVVALVVACSATSPVWEEQYAHCYVNRRDVGRCATLVNTSRDPVPITAAMFTHDPLSTYHRYFEFRGEQMARVRDGAGYIDTGCTVAAFCDGALVINGGPFAAGQMIPGRSAIFIHE
ncbi:MAG: hypothetical protein JO302_00970 [Candidatus Eremiobacteraeota bacterium]|nr:hypothetical protein [Candidatus Eremiobacteraeota bacterium]